LGGWVFDFLPELGATSEVVGAFMGDVGEVAAANVVEVTVKEPKQISTGLARMSAMLAGKKDNRSGCHAAQRVPDLPFLARQMSGGETCTDPKGGYPSGCRLSSGGSGHKSVDGSSLMDSEPGECGKDTRDFRLVQASGE
jgi:hypothetical protein